MDDRQYSIADALFSATQRRVLSLLFGQPHRSFFTTEIINLSRSGRGAVQRELERLEKSGLVDVKRIGNQKHFQAAASSPVFHELCSIVQKTIGLREPLREALGQIADKLDVALLYGSIAKGTDTANSDIDILIVSPELTLEDALKTLAPVEELLNRRINCTIYTPSEFDDRRRKGNAFITRVLAAPHDVLAGVLLDAGRKPAKPRQGRKS